MMEAAASVSAATDAYKAPPVDVPDSTSETSSSSPPPPSPSLASSDDSQQALSQWTESFLPGEELPKRTSGAEGQATELESGTMTDTVPSTSASGADEVDLTSVAMPSWWSTYSSSPPSPPQLASLTTTEGRLQTFKNWPVSFLSAEEMAAAGFCFLNRDDAVECVYCGVVISSWELGDKALDEHRKWSPECEFVNPLRRRCVDAISYDTCRPSESQPQPRPPAEARATPVEAKKATWPQFRTREARLATFKDWPPALPVKPAALSDAGFFYSGVGDRTVCYYCGRGLRDWEPGDDPWLEHELWFPGCWHVLLHKGSRYVQAVADQRDATIAARKSSRQTTKVTPAKGAEVNLPDDTPDNRARENGDTEEKRLCKICFENEMGVVFLPCGHIVACVDCALSCEYCPVCREPFQNTARIYLP